MRQFVSYNSSSASSLRRQFRHRVAGKSARCALLPPSAQRHQSVPVWAQSAADTKVANDVPFFVARLSNKNIDSVWVCSLNHVRVLFPFHQPPNSAVATASPLPGPAHQKSRAPGTRRSGAACCTAGSKAARNYRFVRRNSMPAQLVLLALPVPRSVGGTHRSIS